MRRNGLIACLVGIALMVTLAGCKPAGAGDIETSPYKTDPTQESVSGGETTQPAEPEQTTAPTEETEPVPTTEPTLPPPTDPNSVVVSTPYGYLQYQDQWVEFMRVEQKQDGEILTVRFYALIHEKEYSLFTLTIGGEAEHPAGRITDAQGTVRNVMVRVHELEMDPNLTEGEQNRLFAMQEDINYVLDKLN